MAAKKPQTIKDVAAMLRQIEDQAIALRHAIDALKRLLPKLGVDSFEMLSVSNGRTGVRDVQKYVNQLETEIKNMTVQAALARTEK